MDWRARADEALQRSTILALSTVEEDGGSWTCAVQFQHDGDLVLSFLSMATTRHAANIERDPRVSAAIWSEPGPPGGNLGLQLRGTAHRVGRAGSGWQQFVVQPEEVWCFDSRVDRERHAVDVPARSR